MRLTLDTVKRIPNQAIKFFPILRCQIRQLNILTVSPYLLNRIKFRSISGQPFKADTSRVFGKILLHSLCPMHTPSVHNQNHPLADVSSDRLQKPNHIFSNNIMLMNPPVKCESNSFGRNGKSTDDRESIMALRLIVYRSLSFRCPGAAKKWLEHKPTLIQQNNCPALFFSVFLYVARFDLATALLPFDSALWHDAEAFDSSNPMNGGFSRYEQDGRLCQNAPLSPWLFGEVSKVGWHTQKQLLLSRVVLKASFSALQTDEKAVQGEAWPLMPLCHLSLPDSSSKQQKRAMIPLLWLSLEYPILSLTGLLLVVFGLPTLWRFLLVSYNIIYLRSIVIARINKIKRLKLFDFIPH